MVWEILHSHDLLVCAEQPFFEIPTLGAFKNAASYNENTGKKYASSVSSNGAEIFKMQASHIIGNAW